MAWNQQVFATRSLTAFFFVIVMLVGILWNQWSFLILFTMIHAGCRFEYDRLLATIYPPYAAHLELRQLLNIAGGSCLLLFIMEPAIFLNKLNVTSIRGWLAAGCLLCSIVLEISLSANGRNLLLSLTGWLYITLPITLLVIMRGPNLSGHYNFGSIDMGWILPFMLILSIWINDTMAYIVGSFFGKTPLSSISPKKTWEGTLGGAFLAVVVIALIGYFIFHVNVWFAASIAAIAAITGTVGDLLESKLKRMANVKDSGSIMPGHGGFLDRFDSLLVATLFVWVFLQLVRIS